MPLLQQRESSYESNSRRGFLRTTGNLTTYEFTLQRDKLIVASSLKTEPPVHMVQDSYTADLRKVHCSADWEHNFSIIINRMLFGLLLGQSATSTILVPFTTGKYGWDELSFDKTVWKECDLKVVVVGINESILENAANIRRGMKRDLELQLFLPSSPQPSASDKCLVNIMGNMEYPDVAHLAGETLLASDRDLEVGTQDMIQYVSNSQYA
ncbi:hypothetical protein F5884DRAFT_811979 [Xylogone sp. PMI_703]|nr:hypothetical protein F5884DRAFT_811979 [Xylogone sp. PMI_703]